MLYMLVTTIVLINLLIAMMSDTYQRIQVNEEGDLPLSIHRCSSCEVVQVYSGADSGIRPGGAIFFGAELFGNSNQNFSNKEQNF